MFELVLTQMEAVLCTWIMERNGIIYDKAQALHWREAMQAEGEEEFDELCRVLPVVQRFNLNSTQQLSILLYGGTMHRTVDVPVLDDAGNHVLYKSGKRKGMPKYKKGKDIDCYAGLVTTAPTKSEKGNIVITDDTLKSFKSGSAKLVALYVLNMRKRQKLIRTYIDGFIDRCFDADTLHAEFLHCKTETGRLSCTNPNMQNVP